MTSAHKTFLGVIISGFVLLFFGMLFTLVQGAISGGSPSPEVQVTSDLSHRTAFGELLVAELTPQIQVAFNYNINSRLVATSSLNGGTITRSDALDVLSTGTNTFSSSTINSLNVLKYNPGQGAEVRFTALFTDCTANSNQEIGVGDDEDGFFFACRGSDFGILRRHEGVNTFVAQSAWNGDKMDGTGASGQTLDITQGNVYEINYQWLGFGAITFEIEDSTTGDFREVHKIAYANKNTESSVHNPTLPIRMRVENVTNTSDIVMKTGSWGAFIEGKGVDAGFGNATSTVVNVGTTEIPLISIRNDTTFQSITNRVRVKVTIVSFSSDGTKVGTIFVRRDATLTGAIFSNIDSDTSVVSVDTAATAISGGRLAFPIQMGKTDSLLLPITELNFIINPGDVVSFSAQQSGGTSDIGVSVGWIELF